MQVTILCYHKVGPVSEEGRRLNIEPARLRSHVRFFSRQNHTFVRVSELLGSWRKGMVCFTFDDAYESTMVHAPGIFEEVGARATFYAVPGRVGTVSDWDGQAARPLANWDLLRDAESNGHEIGNHTQNHVHLDSLDEKDQLNEIVAARDRLESEGLRSSSFCFPYGGYDERTVGQLQNAGYKVAVTLDKRPATREDDLLRLPRVVSAYSDTLPMLIYKLKLRPRLRRMRR